MGIRTDLITEQQELHTETVSGAVTSERSIGAVKLKTVVIKDTDAAEQLGKPPGTYITAEYGNIISSGSEVSLKQAVISALSQLIPTRSNILVVGLGNRDITPDAIGPLAVDRMFATRHIGRTLREQLGLEGLNSVSALIPGVLGKTGIEAVEIIRGTVQRTSPDAVIVIDALAARHTERLCRTVQLCNTGISPGSGVENSRSEISEAVLGVPVTAIGIPTVVDIRTLIYDLTESAAPINTPMMVTPTDIDLQIRRLADLLAQSLNMFLQPSLDEATLQSLV